MPPIRDIKQQKLVEQEDRIELAIKALNERSIASVAATARIFDVPRSTLRDRMKGAIHRPIARANRHKLTEIQDDFILEWILFMDERGQEPQRVMVKEMANLLLAKRGDHEAITVGNHWVDNFVIRNDCLKTRYSRLYNNQRALCEDPRVIKPWFDIILKTIAEYGIHDDDIYNFDETGFAMGVANTSKVIIRSEYNWKRKLLQPGNREWVTVIECFNQNKVLPPTIIFKGKNFMEHWSIWHQEIGALNSVIMGGQLTKLVCIGSSKPLFHTVNSTKKVPGQCLSWMAMEVILIPLLFDDTCKQNNIIAICMPPHSSHLL